MDGSVIFVVETDKPFINSTITFLIFSEERLKDRSALYLR